jgi:hypothetical protein
MKEQVESKFRLFQNSEKKPIAKPGKNILKSRIHSMDKGWIGKKREIKGMNRLSNGIKTGVTGSLFR